jgi:hypothetical protein
VSVAFVAILAQSEPTSSLVDRVSVHIEGGAGTEATTRSGASLGAASGAADVGLATSTRKEGLSPYVGVTARGDTGGYGQIGAGVGIVTLSRDPASLHVQALALGGFTSYQAIGSIVIPMAGAAVSVSQRLGQERRFALGGTLGAAFVFPGDAGDVVDTQAVSITSSDPVGYAGWCRLSATYFFTSYLGAGAFVAFNMGGIGNGVITPRGITSSWLSDYNAVSGLELMVNL